jgi:hypothetical protein
MKFFKLKNIVTLNKFKYSFVCIFIFLLIFQATFFTNITSASLESISVSNITQTTAVLNLSGLQNNIFYDISVKRNNGTVDYLQTHMTGNGSLEIVASGLFPNTVYTAYLLNNETNIPITHKLFNTISVVLPPKITSFSPSSGKWNDIVTITGENFTGANQVFFGEFANAIPQTVNDTSITVLVPRTAVTQRIYVRVPGYEDATSSTDFVVTTTNTPGSGTCTDGIMNQDETGIDTGGVCTTAGGGTGPGGGATNKPGLVPECNTGAIDPVTKNYVNACGFDMVMTIINNVITFLLVTLATPLFALIIIYAGWLYLSDMGSSENITHAKKILKNAVIGYVIALAAWLIVKTILTSLGFEGEMYLSSLLINFV